ncbi:MAG: hypothetical protein HY805_05765 [Nitrospirae bacterium]|nr:hypothetical protein [Nitrospirota bacterium]
MMQIKAQAKNVNPNKLPFLQAQVLQKIYMDLHEQKHTTIEDLSELTGYPKESKILADAIQSLIEKGFLEGDLFIGFGLPEQCIDLFSKIVKRNDYRHKNYSDEILTFFHDKNISLRLFNFDEQTISELNKYGIVHRWYNYLEEFPYTLIEDKIKEYQIKPSSLVIDPFVGSGTTLVSANMFRCNAIGFDTNPLMVFISTVKTTWEIDLTHLKKEVYKVGREFLENIKDYDKLHLKKGFIGLMPKKELNQWLSPTLQKEVNLLKNIIDEVESPKIRNALLLALAKSCFDASYVSLCPGTTFYPFREKEEFWDLFIQKIIQVYDDLKAIQRHNHYGTSTLINDTCLNADKYIKPKSIDFIITSPPYPNDLEYTRQTRLELYLLDFVKNMGEVQQIKRKMVKGSTKLIFKESNSEVFASKFNEVKIVSDRIYEQTKDKNWGFDYPRMVREYFGDMYLCLRNFYSLMKKDAHFLLVVGDQTVKGVYIPVCDVLIKMAEEIGYKNCRKELFRMRRSTGHSILLPEEIVIIQK